jgi:hypothetical protein
VKRIATLSVLGLLAFCLTCSRKAKIQKKYLEMYLPEVEKALATEGFETEVSVIRRGEVFDMRIDLKGLVSADPEWEKASYEERLGRFARVCASFLGDPSEDFLSYGNLLIGYEDRLWSVSFEYCDYILSHSLSRSKSEAQLEKELIEEMELVE